MAVAERIHKEIEGRVAVGIDDLLVLGRYLIPGDHLEIGTLFGGSAIFAALVKDSGSVTCIDPLDGYYRNVPSVASPKDLSGLVPDRELLERNVQHFGAQLRIIQALSSPWPIELAEATFTTAYIDGNHWGDGPRNDWKNIKDRTSEYVIFHDYGKNNPVVMDTCHDAAEDPEWELVEQTGFSYVLSRS